MTRSPGVIPSLVIAATLAACGDNQRQGPPGGDFEVLVASADARVLPGGELSVGVTLRNVGDTTWPRGTLFAYEGDPAWGATDFRVPRRVPPGDMLSLAQTFSAPVQIGLHTLAWRGQGQTGPFGPEIAVRTEVTCSDGVFCNGDERYVAGACVSGPPPCDDGATCTADVCDEASGVCAWDLGPECASCDRGACTPDCAGKTCGDDGCGGSCGDCAAGLFCVDGACGEVTQPGTCPNPLPLVAPGEPLLGTHVINGDTSAAVNTTAPACNTASDAPELVYTFTTAEVVGIDARMSGYDTVLDLRAADCTTSEASAACSDDATPPGDFGSRVATRLEPGTYYLIADGYSAIERGPFTLTVRFTDGCVPQCDGRFCGPDACDGECGACAAGEACNEFGRCLPDPCVPLCDGRECGGDGCGGQCGECGSDAACSEAAGVCLSFPTCDHALPTCEGCGADEYCGTDCECHAVGAPGIDLVVGRARLEDEIVVETRNFDDASCSVFEGCVGGTGTRKLLRFTVASVNQGRGTFEPPPPEARPDLFEFSLCHGHFHFKGFAEYALLDTQGRLVVPGRKQAYCLVDSEQAAVGPTIACEPVHDCTAQGLQAGWADIYANDLDCQWLDVTDVPPGAYQLSVTLNPERIFDEVSFDNNTTIVPVILE